jgi:hypothetical protein
MITAETWMTADEAIAAGFANGVGEAPPIAEDAPADAPAADAAPTMTADAVVWNGVTFPVGALPQQQVVLAMAKPIAAPVVAAVAPQLAEGPSFTVGSRVRVLGEPHMEGQDTGEVREAVLTWTYGVLFDGMPGIHHWYIESELESAAGQEMKMKTVGSMSRASNPTVTREILSRHAPELLAELVSEGHAAGVAAERARLQAIDELTLRGCDDLVSAAKYGEKPTDAPTLAVAVVKAGKQAGLELLEARKRESTEAAGVKSTPPAKNTEDAGMAAAKNIAEMANRRRGGTR